MRPKSDVHIADIIAYMIASILHVSFRRVVDVIWLLSECVQMKIEPNLNCFGYALSSSAKPNISTWIGSKQTGYYLLSTTVYVIIQDPCI